MPQRLIYRIRQRLLTDTGRRNAGLQGRLRQYGAGDHRPGDVMLVPNPSYPIHASVF